MFEHDTPDEHSEFNPRCKDCRREAQEDEIRQGQPAWLKRLQPKDLTGQVLS